MAPMAGRQMKTSIDQATCERAILKTDLELFEWMTGVFRMRIEDLFVPAKAVGSRGIREYTRAVVLVAKRLVCDSTVN